jgi:hypothetical protein
MKARLAALGAAMFALSTSPDLLAQRMTLPPSGGHQKASVSQNIGLVEVAVKYSGPSVVAPDGTDRRGKIWGGLVKYGLQKEDYGTCGAACPWRAGANENTVFRVSHPVLVEGKLLAAGTYGLHMIPGAEEFTVIFSKNSSSWGSYFYDAKEDALRVSVKPRKAPFTPLLTYEFVERRPDRATLVLRWDELEVPVSISVENPTALWVENLGKELRGQRGGTWQSWDEAAQFCLREKVNLPEALKWADYAVHAVYVGTENFETLSTLAGAQTANGLAEESRKTMQKALNHPSATANEIHMHARQLQMQGKSQEAIAVFELNGKRYPGVWPVNVGLARAAAASGKPKEALRYAKLALAQAPDEGNRTNLKNVVEMLEAGKEWKQ